MRLVCHIGDLEGTFDIVQGATFSEDYNETLDSGNIIIVSKNKQLNIKPYDDVVVFDYEANPNGYIGWGSNVAYIGFYRHLLVDNFSEEMIYQGETSDINSVYFKYKISLFSETKKLEKIIVPRISITQPIKNGAKHKIRYYLEKFLELYNPQIKKGTKANWNYSGKYSFAHNFANIGEDNLYIFNNIWCPEFTLGEATFRELLTELFQVADRIPYVKDDVIYALNISEKKGQFQNVGQLNFPVRSMTSADYCTNLRTTYSDALPQEYSAHSVECIGFRNSDEALMTLENMRLELSFPIYKINHVYMHYYKNAVAVLKKIDDSVPGDPSIIYSYYPVLITQDITKLVKMNTEVLSKDWNKFNNNPISSMDDAAKFDFSTVKYSQGSRYITGWGEKYQYPVGEWLTSQTRTHIENILRITDNLNRYGVSNVSKIAKDINDKISNKLNYRLDSVEIPGINLRENVIQSVLKNFFGSAGGYNETETLKDLFFTVDYQPFYNGAVVHSKAFGEVNENLTTIDNPNNSLSLLERDGIAQREKLERFGVSTLQINARYTNINQLQPVGSEYNSIYVNDGLNQEVIMYHREYSIYDNVINCVYYGSQQYVLKNYYTSVFAKYRTYNLMPYSQSVKRSENQKYYIYLSLENKTLEEKLSGLELTNFKPLWLSGIFETIRDNIDSRDNRINNAYYYVPYYKVWHSDTSSFSNETNGYFVGDFMSFSTGDSLVLNSTMIDNIVGGTYWEKADHEITWFDDPTDDVRGTSQNQYYIADYNDGTLYNIKFGFIHKKSLGFDTLYFDSNTTDEDEGLSIDVNKIKKRPLLLGNINSDSCNHISVSKNFYKDNKEVIDFSLQFEYVCDEDIFISQWFIKLNDLITDFYKQKDPQKDEPLSISEINTIYVGVGYEKPAATVFGGPAQWGIDYAGSGGGNFGHGNFDILDGRYYMDEDFYKSIAGVNNMNQGGLNITTFTFANPVLFFAIDKNLYDSASNGYEFNVNYNYGKINLSGISANDTSKAGYGNPYLRGSGASYVTNLSISLKNIHITKGSSKTEFIRETIGEDTTTEYHNKIILRWCTQAQHDLLVSTFNYPNRSLKRFGYEYGNCWLVKNNLDRAYVFQNSTQKKYDLGDLEIPDFDITEYTQNNAVRDEETNEYDEDEYFFRTKLETYYRSLINIIKTSENIPQNETIYLIYKYEFPTLYERDNLMFFGFFSSDIYGFQNNGYPKTIDGLMDIVASEYNNGNSLNNIDLDGNGQNDKAEYIEYFDNKMDWIIYSNSPYQIERVCEDIELKPNTYLVEREITYEYDDSLLTSYANVVVSYDLSNGITHNVPMKLPLTISEHNGAGDNVGGFYMFKSTIRFVGSCSPLQLDLKSNEEPQLINANFTVNSYFDTSNNILKWQSEASNETTDGDTTTKITYNNYPQMMLAAMKAGIADNILTSEINNFKSKLDKVLNTGDFVIGGLDTLLSNSVSTTSQNIKTFGNLYYCLCSDKLDNTSKYKVYDLENLVDVTNPIRTSINESTGVATIDLSDVGNASNYKSLVVLYRTNEELGVWKGANAPIDYTNPTNLQFVFGMNLEGKDLTTPISIKPTLLQSRDRRVYDNSNLLKGNLDKND